MATQIAELKTIVIIPAYNEENSISYVVSSVLKDYPSFKVLVVDDGSTDATSIRSKQAGAKVISLPQNLGIGGARQAGFLYAFYNNFDIAVQIDADGQHRTDEISKIINPILANEADLVLGSRYVEKTEYKSSLARRSGMIIFSTLVSLIAKQKILDTTSGFRAVNKELIRLFAQDYSTDYPEVDSLVTTKKYGMRIKEVSVKMNQRIAGRSSITQLKSFYYMVKVGLALFIRSLPEVRKG